MRIVVMTSDTYDHLVPHDLRQGAIIMSAMLYNAVMRDKMLPRASSTR
jgi:hypothetical protein